MTYQQILSLPGGRRGFRELTDAISQVVKASGLRTGLCHLFLRHTSASLCITENADPEVRADLERWMQRAVPDGDPLLQHVEEGEDDMPAHLRNLLVGHQLTVPVGDGRLLLGTWQGIYLWEHRLQTQHRELVVTLQGDRDC